MPENVRLNEDLQLIEVHSHGVVTDKDLLQTLQQIERLMTRTRITAVLIDTLEQTSAPGTFALNTITQRLPAKARFAILSGDDHPSRSKQDMTEKVAGGQGRAVRVFSDREKAVRWLTAG